MTLDARIEIIDDGFFHPRDQFERDHTDANRFHHVPVSGLAISAQFVRTLVHLPSTESPSGHLVIWAHVPRRNDDAVARMASSLQAAFPDTPATFVIDVSLLNRGEWTYDADIRAWSADPRVAGVSAVCAAQCWGTLADIQRVTVRIDGRLYCATMQSGDGAWLASVALSNEGAGPRSG